MRGRSKLIDNYEFLTDMQMQPERFRLNSEINIGPHWRRQFIGWNM